MVEPTEEQYMVINALDTLDLLRLNFYDENRGVWYIETPSPLLPISKVLENGEVVPIEPESEV